MEYTIPFVSLDFGKHDFSYDIEDNFFLDFEEESNIRAGKLNVKLILERKPSFLVLDFSIEGMTKVECDRCLDLLKVDVKQDGKIYVKFGYSQVEDPDVIFISPEDTEIDLKQIIYELISLSIPIRNVHPDDENGESTCNQEMIALLNQHSVNNGDDEGEDEDENNETDPRWDKLNSLFS